MAKGEAKTTNRAIDSARTQTQNFQSNFGNTMQQRGDAAYASDSGIKNDLVSGYGAMANTGGITPEQEARLRGLYTGLNTGGGGGGYSAPAYTYAGGIGEVEGKARDFMNGGGVNRYALGTFQDLTGARGGLSDELWNPIQESISGFKNIAANGGYSPETRAKIEGMIGDIKNTENLDPEMMAAFKGGLQGYNEFANTGGVNDQQARDIMARGQSVIPSFYGSMQQQLANSGRVQGGYNPGMAASARNLAREKAAAAQAAARDTRLGLQDTVNEGRQWGIKGLTDSSLAGATAMNDAAYRAASDTATQTRGFEQDAVANSLAGLTGAGNTANALAGTVSGNRIAGGQGLNDIMNTDLQASMFGTNMMNQIVGNKAQEAQSQASAAAAAAAQNYQNNLAMAQFGAGIEKYLIDTGNENKLAGLGGLGNVYTSTPGETGMYYDNQLKNQQLTGGQVQDNLALRAQYNPNVSGWDKVMQGLQVGTGVAGAFMGGLGGFGGGGGGGGTGNTGGFTGINMNSPITPSNWNQPNFQGSGNTGFNPNIYGNLFGG